AAPLRRWRFESRALSGRADSANADAGAPGVRRLASLRGERDAFRAGAIERALSRVDDHAVVETALGAAIDGGFPVRIDAWIDAIGVAVAFADAVLIGLGPVRWNGNPDLKLHLPPLLIVHACFA